MRTEISVTERSLADTAKFRQKKTARNLDGCQHLDMMSSYSGGERLIAVNPLFSLFTLILDPYKKNTLVVMGNSVLIEGLECSGIHVPSGNGACLRLEGKDITIRKVFFHDSEEGILGGRGLTVIEDSRFERLG